MPNVKNNLMSFSCILNSESDGSGTTYNLNDTIPNSDNKTYGDLIECPAESSVDYSNTFVEVWTCVDPNGNAATCEGDNPGGDLLYCDCKYDCYQDSDCSQFTDENGLEYICLIGQDNTCAPCSESVYASASGEINQVWNWGRCERDCDCVSGHCCNGTCRGVNYNCN